MTKRILIEKISAATGLQISVCVKVIDQLSVQIVNELVTGDQCVLPGIGKLIVKTRSARLGRNPKTGDKVSIPSTRVVSLRTTKNIKSVINNL